MARLTFHLPDELLEKLDVIAESRYSGNRSMVIVRAIEDLVEHLDDNADKIEAMEKKYEYISKELKLVKIALQEVLSQIDD